MPNPEQPWKSNTPEAAWKSQGEEPQQNRNHAPTPDELCAMAQSREKLNARLRGGVIVTAFALAAAFLYNVYRIDQPWIRLGQAWTLGVVVYLFVIALEGGRRRRTGTSEPCAEFLWRQHEERRRGYLRIRSRLYLVIPGIAASWWGGGPLAGMKAGEIDPASWLYQFLAGPWPFLIAIAALVLVWFAFGKAAEKAAREREEVQRLITP